MTHTPLYMDSDTKVNGMYREEAITREDCWPITNYQQCDAEYYPYRQCPNSAIWGMPGGQTGQYVCTTHYLKLPLESEFAPASG